MTDPKTPRDLAELVGQAFAERGELPPTTEAEVERAESSGVEDDVALPDSLLDYQPPSVQRQPAGVVSLDEARRSRARSVFTHAAAIAIGAAAAAFVFSLRDRPQPIGGVPSVEPRAPRRDAAPAPPERTAIGPVRQCATPCCAGASCASAKPELRACPSGRSCVGCTLDQLGSERYRLSLSSFAPADAARKLLERPGARALELCVQVGSSKLECVPAHAASSTEPWTLLSLSVSAQDLVHGFVFQMRAPGVAKPLAEWRNAVRLDPSLLCKGLFIRAKTANDEPFGTVSVFLQDMYFVELARNESALELDQLAARFTFSDVEARIFQTTKPGRDRFALAIGPLSKSAAERLRSELTRAEQSATITAGEDHVGAPLSER